jgi:hypothetical protein
VFLSVSLFEQTLSILGFSRHEWVVLRTHHVVLMTVLRLGKDTPCK